MQGGLTHAQRSLMQINWPTFKSRTLTPSKSSPRALPWQPSACPDQSRQVTHTNVHIIYPFPNSWKMKTPKRQSTCWIVNCYTDNFKLPQPEPKNSFESVSLMWYSYIRSYFPVAFTCCPDCLPSDMNTESETGGRVGSLAVELQVVPPTPRNADPFSSDPCQ